MEHYVWLALAATLGTWFVTALGAATVDAELIQTLDDVMKIQSEGREKRIAAEAEMAKMENDLKGKLLEIRGGV